MAELGETKGWRRHCLPGETNPADGPAGGRPVHRVVRSAVAYGILVLLLTAFFIHGRQLSYRYLGGATFLGMVFGLAVAGFDRSAFWLRTVLAARCSRVICGFVLFFAYLLGYLVLFSLIVTYPVGVLIEQGSGSAAMAIEYGLSTSNVILFFAVLGWLDWGRLVANRMFPLPWRRGGSVQEAEGAKTLDK